MKKTKVWYLEDNDDHYRIVNEALHEYFDFKRYQYLDDLIRDISLDDQQILFLDEITLSNKGAVVSTLDVIKSNQQFHSLLQHKFWLILTSSMMFKDINAAISLGGEYLCKFDLENKVAISIILSKIDKFLNKNNTCDFQAIYNLLNTNEKIIIDLYRQGVINTLDMYDKFGHVANKSKLISIAIKKINVLLAECGKELTRYNRTFIKLVDIKKN